MACLLNLVASEVVYKKEGNGGADSFTRNSINVKNLDSLNIWKKENFKLESIIMWLNKSNKVKDWFKIIDKALYKSNYDPLGKKWMLVIPKHFRLEILHHNVSRAVHLKLLKSHDQNTKKILLTRHI